MWQQLAKVPRGAGDHHLARTDISTALTVAHTEMKPVVVVCTDIAGQTSLHLVHSISQSIISAIRVQTRVIAANCRSRQVPCLYCSATIIGRANCQYNDEDMEYINNTRSVTCDCGEPQTMARILCCRLLDEPCSSDDLPIVTERATACARIWQHIV